MDAPSPLVELCVQKLAQCLIKYGPKKIRFSRLADLPRRALEALIEILVAKNALNDNVLPHTLTHLTQKLGLEGQSQLRRCVLNTIGRSCPNLRILDVRGCQQVDNRIVRDALQYCERLETLRLDGCTRISDSAFAPALWKPPLAGLLGLRELSVGKCGQITAEGLMAFVMKGAPFLRTLGLAFCRLAITDDVASELLFGFGLEVLDLSFCAQITDAPFQAAAASTLRELHVANTPVSDVAVESIARRAPGLEVFDAGWVMKLTDRSILQLAETCTHLRVLCVCHTQLTDAAFEAVARCRHLQRLDASWCLRATPQALETLAAAAPRPPLRELVLDHLGALNLDVGLDCFSLPPPPSSPGLWDACSLGRGSSANSPWLPMPVRLPPEPPSLALPPPVQLLPPGASASADEPLSPGLPSPPAGMLQAPSSVSPATLKGLVAAYGGSLEQLLLDGIRDVVGPSALEDIAAACPVLQQLALTFPPAGRECETAWERGLRAVGEQCRQLSMVRFDASARPHQPLVASLAPPCFPRLSSITLWCASKGGGLRDSELETILSGRTGLKALALRNCEGLSESLFPKWCNRGERHDEAEVLEQLDLALMSSLQFGGPAGGMGPLAPAPAPQPDPPRISRRRQHPRSPCALALRSVTSLTLGGAAGLSDRSGDALAELLHDVQTVDLRGCPLLTEESLRSFRKGCRFLRSVSIVLRERTLSWTASTRTVKKHRHRKSSSFGTSGSSGTESN
mmetsp:Transcript_31595/g.90662  ORF Transcript_31595/g.90662 Transcript_31595/m.90662 type:complete len:742 (+) Transcript_31595:133-2358(+)